MSPDLAFILTLALRMAITAAFVVSASDHHRALGPGDRRAGCDIADFGRAFLRIPRARSRCGLHRRGRAGEPADQRRHDLAGADLCRAGAAPQRAGQLRRRGRGVDQLAALMRTVHWSLAGGLIANAVTFAICLPLLRRFRHVKMPLITRRWYDIPLRASLVATLVATVVTLSRWVGPSVSGMIALFPVVFTSMMLILHPRIGGKPTAAVIANGGWGLIGFGIAIAVLNVTAPRFGSAVALSLALATCVSWNLGLWWNGRRKLAVSRHSGMVR